MAYLLLFFYPQPNFGDKDAMMNNENTCKTPTGDVWFISPGQFAKVDSGSGHLANATKTATIYEISEIAYYMLNPDSLQIQNRLVGCSIRYRESKRWYKKLFFKKASDKKESDKTQLQETVTSDLDTELSEIKDRNLLSHIRGIYDQIRPYDRVIRTISNLDERKVSDLEGICRDEAGNLKNIALNGSLEDKINYMKKNLLQKVPLSIKRAYMGSGLFEMSGFDFSTYNPENTYNLIRSRENGNNPAYVLSNDQQVKYRVENFKFIFYLQLLEQLVKVNPELKNAFSMCIAGKAKPLKLFFKSQLGIDYSVEKLPEIYQEVFKKHNIDVNQKKIVANALRDRQLGISFISIPRNFSGKNRLETNLSVLHNFRALEAIKEEAPKVFSEIDNMAAMTEVGRFYLLDKYKGYKE